MQILPDDFAIQLLLQIKEVSSQFFSVLLDAVAENIATNWIGLWGGIFAGEWDSLIPLGIAFFSPIILGYRLIRNNLFDSIEYLHSKF